MIFVEDAAMKDFDFGYLGKGDEGYAQYMTAFERDFPTEDSFDSDASLDDDMDDADEI